MSNQPYDFLRGVGLFSDVSDKDLRGIATSMRQREFAEGDTIVVEGDSGVGFFLVESGTAVVTHDGVERAALGAGDYFGEVALLAGGDRTATVSAKTDVVCWALPGWSFRPLVREHPSVTMKLLEGMARQLAGRTAS
jgi:CRP-like cAMP-binding protein